MLKVNPSNRPSCEIRVPKNLHFLTDKLPKSNYSLIKQKRLEKTENTI